MSGSIVRATDEDTDDREHGGHLINIGVDYILIFGLIDSGTGVLGTAIGTVRQSDRLYLDAASDSKVDTRFVGRLQMAGSGQVITLSVPASKDLSCVWGRCSITLIVSIGVTTYASHVIAGNIESFVYMPATLTALRFSPAEPCCRTKPVRSVSARSLGLLIMGAGGVLLFWFTAFAKSSRTIRWR